MINNLKQKKLDKLYMDLAVRISKMSYAKRKKVGGILVKDNNIISFGWNGMPSGFDNCCEDENNNTKSEVLHAELNLISKVAKTPYSTDRSILYLTLAPCIECAKILLQCGIKRIVYLEEYRIKDGINFLKKTNVIIEQFND